MQFILDSERINYSYNIIRYLDHQIVWGFGDKRGKHCQNCNTYYTGSEKVTIGKWKIYPTLVSTWVLKKTLLLCNICIYLIRSYLSKLNNIDIIYNNKPKNLRNKYSKCIEIFKTKSTQPNLYTIYSFCFYI